MHFVACCLTLAQSLALDSKNLFASGPERPPVATCSSAAHALACQSLELFLRQAPLALKGLGAAGVLTKAQSNGIMGILCLLGGTAAPGRALWTSQADCTMGAGNITLIRRCEMRVVRWAPCMLLEAPGSLQELPRLAAEVLVPIFRQGPAAEADVQRLLCLAHGAHCMHRPH